MVLNEVVLYPLGAFAGSGVAGFLAGYALRKVLRIVAIAIGILLVAIMALAAKQWIIVQWDKIGDSIQSFANITAATQDVGGITHNITNSLGLPATGGLSLGFAFGFMRG